MPKSRTPRNSTMRSLTGNPCCWNGAAADVPNYLREAGVGAERLNILRRLLVEE
jgi:hypothetical protein